MEVVNYILDLDDMVLSAERPKILEGINSWTDFYEDDGDALLAKADGYESYRDFEKAYFAEYQTTPLHHAIKSNKASIVRKVLLRGADVNSLDNLSIAPLYYSILLGDEEIVQLLLSNGAKAKGSFLENSCELTYFQRVCETSHWKIVKLFLSYGCDPNEVFTNNTTPLYQGIRHGDHKIVELLLMNGALIENDNAVANIYDPLHVAISAGHLKIIEDLLSYGLNVNMKSNSLQNENYPAFLHTAVENEQIEIVNLLLRYNAEVNIKDGLGRTPLHIAALNENEVMIELLLQYDPDLKDFAENSTLNAVDKDGSTPLHKACKGRNIDCVQCLLINSSDINAENFKGETPLHLACEVGEFSIVNLLIKNKAPINANTEDNMTPLHVAVTNSHEKIVELLLMNEAITTNKDKDKKIPLKLAVENSDMKIIELLLQYNPDVNNKYYKRVFFEVLALPKTYGLEIIECFFKYGFIIGEEDKNNDEVIIKTVSNGYLKIFEQLVNDGLNVNSIIKGETLLHIATKNMYCDIVKFLINRKANLYAKDQNGKIPIFCAVENNDKMLVELFLNSGINVKMYPELLHYTIIKCSNKCKDIIEILLKYGADINYCDDHGVNAVHLIIQFLRKDIRAEQYNLTKLHDYVITDSVIDTVKFLLEKGVNVNAKTKFGWSALHMAIVLDDNLEKLVETLLEYDADADCKNELGNTPLHLSCQKANFSVISILLDHGADVNVEDASGRTPLDAVFEIKHEYQKKAEEISAAVFMNCVEDLINSYFLTRTYIDFCNEAVMVFQNHITKMNTANIYLSPKNTKYLDKKDKFFEAKCEKEINVVKGLRINNYVSVYDILVKDLTDVARYTKNENIQEIYWLLETPMKFPVYGSMILQRLKKAVRRQNFSCRAMEALNTLSGYLLPESCAETVFIYLKNKELNNLADVLPVQDMKMEVSE